MTIELPVRIRVGDGQEHTIGTISRPQDIDGLLAEVRRAAKDELRAACAGPSEPAPVREDEPAGDREDRELPVDREQDQAPRDRQARPGRTR